MPGSHPAAETEGEADLEHVGHRRHADVLAGEFLDRRRDHALRAEHPSDLLRRRLGHRLAHGGAILVHADHVVRIHDAERRTRKARRQRVRKRRHRQRRGVRRVVLHDERHAPRRGKRNGRGERHCEADRCMSHFATTFLFSIVSVPSQTILPVCRLCSASLKR